MSESFHLIWCAHLHVALLAALLCLHNALKLSHPVAANAITAQLAVAQT